jgi:hypothetical protein
VTRARRRRLAAAILTGLALLGAQAGAAQGNELRATCSTAGLPAVDCGTAWFRSDVTLRWTWSPEPTDTNGCDVRTFRSDTAGTTVVCSVSWGASSASFSVTIRLDKAPPVVGPGVPSRPPDHRGWYRRPVTVRFSGFDATSGIRSCTGGVYRGPATPAATVVGTCVDYAGNPATAGFRLAYDASPPALTRLRASGADRVAFVSWKAAGAASVTVVRSPGRGRAAHSVVYRGGRTRFRDTRVRDRVRYRYRLIATDLAGNRSVRSVSIMPGPRLLRPGPRAVLRRPPVLAWTPVRRAHYYNVQLHARGKILSAWPARPRLRVPRAWTFGGRRHRLRPGRYRWYVWPGFGRRAARRYGRLIGSRTFVVR